MPWKPLPIDREIRNILACPYCKSRFTTGMELDGEAVCCTICDAVFPVRENGVIDFRITPPSYSQPLFHTCWSAGQRGYERWARNLPEDANYYLEQIEQSKRTFCSLYDYASIDGILIDVGGNDGRLRHFLPTDVVYASLDPYLTVREDLVRKGRLEAYPVLATPSNFICGRAEQLPFVHGKVDYVRCNSVLDHLWDPFLALREIYRVLKPGGTLLFGVHVVEDTRRTLKEKTKSIVKFLLRRPQDRHLWHPTRNQLLEIMKLAGFQWLDEMFIDETKSLEVVLRRAAKNGE